MDLTVKLENGVRGFFYNLYFTTHLVVMLEKRYIFIKELNELNVKYGKREVSFSDPVAPKCDDSAL